MQFCSKILFLITLLFLTTFTACMKKEVYPNEPIIKFQEFKRFNNDSAWFIFTFTDGDGDIGLKTSDTTSPFNIKGDYYYNFHLQYHEKQNGKFIQPDQSIPFSYRIPYITPEAKNKALEGEVIVRIPFSYFDFSSSNDTIKYSAFIYDRALHKSNVIETTEMVVIK